MKVRLVQRLISPECYSDFVRIDELMRSLLDDSRPCSQCNEVVNLYPFHTDNPGPGRPFDSVAVRGCEKIIDRVIEGFIEEFNFADCFERMKSQNAAGVAE